MLGAQKMHGTPRDARQSRVYELFSMAWRKVNVSVMSKRARTLVRVARPVWMNNVAQRGAK
jgi:hypothetical protein